MFLLGHRESPLSSRSAALADRLVQIPRFYRRAAGDVLVLGDLVQLLAVAILQRTARLPPALTNTGRLLAELAARALRKPRDRTLAPRRLSCLLHVSLRSLTLACRSHLSFTSILLLLVPYPPGRVLVAGRAPLVGADQLGHGQHTALDRLFQLGFRETGA